MSLTSVTSAQDTVQQVQYVTGCLGSNSVMLHSATSAEDARAVFVYKGGEILGSDIIPAQGDYKVVSSSFASSSSSSFSTHTHTHTTTTTTIH